MKKFRKTFLLMNAIFLLFAAIPTQAAGTKKNYESGTKKMSLTLEKSGLQSFDGTLSVSSKTDGTKITLKSAVVKTGNTSHTELCSYENGKIYMVTDGTAVKLQATVNLEVSGDGTYEVKLSGYGTDEKGNYNRKKKNVNVSAVIVVGEETEENEETKEETKDTSEKVEEDNTKETDTKETKEETIVRKKETLEDSEKTEKQQQEEKENERLIQEILEAAETEKEPETEKEVSKKNSGIALLPWLLAIFFLCCVIIGILLWKLRKGKSHDYDGAPMIDYDIEDDDQRGEG